MGNILLPDSDSGIADRYYQYQMSGIHFLIINSQRHLSSECVLYCIGQQIDHNLADPYFITIQLIRHPRIIHYAKTKALLRCLDHDHIMTVVHQRSHVIPALLQLDIPTPDLGKIQNIINNAQQ